MIDREKVIKGLEICSDPGSCSSECPYYEKEAAECSCWLFKDALELLKEQETVVRCKDCKHHLECDYWVENGDGWYCANGERR